MKAEVTKTAARYVSNLVGALRGKAAGIVWNTSGYNAATRGRRTIGMGQSTRGVSSLAMADGPMLTARARKAAMDNPLAVNGIQSFIAEAIGTGMRPHSKHSNPTKRRNLEKEFSLWTAQSSATRRVGLDGKPDSLHDFYTQQMLVCRNVVETGEAFGRLRPRAASDLSPTGLRVPIQIDLIEPEQLAFWRMSASDQAPNTLVRASIEFNQIHERVAYHFYREHPGDSGIWPNAYEVVRVPAGSVLHVMEFIRGNQIRGITSLAPILIALADLDDYDDAERFRQKLGAYMFAWRESLTPDDPQVQGLERVGNDTAPPGAEFVEAQPGTMTMLDANAGEKFGFYAHPGVTNTYEVFMRVQRQTIATILRNTYEMLTGDMNQVNYSSARVRLIALRRTWRQFQRSVIEHQFCRPVWRAWLDAAALVGVINARDYVKNPEEYLNVEWLPQPWEWVDPKADVTAIRMEVESCFTSREAVVTARGRNVEDVDAEIKRDHDREAKLGIVPVYGNSRVSETVPPGDNEELADTEPTPPDSPAPSAPKKPSKVRDSGQGQAIDGHKRGGDTELDSRSDGRVAWSDAVDRLGLDRSGVETDAGAPAEQAIRLEEITRRIAGRPTLIHMEAAGDYFGDPAPYRIQDGIASIDIFGALSNAAWSWGGITYGDLRNQFTLAQFDPNVRGVVLNINSPGGETDNAFETAAVLAALSAVKPVFAVASTRAASAAYLLAAQTNRIYCPTTTGGVGSIGIAATHMDLSGALDQAGIAVTLLSAGTGKTDGNPYEPLTPRARVDMQAEVDRLYTAFVDAVATGRGMRPRDVVKLGAHMFYGSSTAIASGLADIAGDASTALADILAIAR